MRKTLFAVLLALAVVLGAVLMPPSASASDCKIVVGGHVGWRKCEMKYVDILYPNGFEEVVVVGTDLKIYHILYAYGSWGNWSWFDYGLAASDASGLYLDGRSGNVMGWVASELAVSGTDGRYCKKVVAYSTWTRWYHC
jgi:hypothetical protein